MAGRRNFETVGPWVLMASAVSAAAIGPSSAADLTVSTARTTVAETAAGDGTGPGNITIQANGSVVVPTGNAAAVVVNSSHTVSNLGSVGNAQVTGASGIFGSLSTTAGGVTTPRDLTSRIQNLGQITVVGPASTDALFNTDAFNAGIRIAGTGTFTGSVLNDRVTSTDGATTSTGSITVGGKNSYGIAIQSNMIGDLVNAGGIIMGGVNNYGIMTTGRITGSIVNSGGINASESSSIGAYIGGGVTGTMIHSGTMAIGLGPQLTSTNGVTVTTTTPISGYAGLWVASDITDGLLLSGNRLTLSQESANPTAAAALIGDSGISVIGSGNALFITQGGPAGALGNITIGPRTGNEGYAVVSQGNLFTVGSIGGLNTSVVDIEGVKVGNTIYTTTLVGGFWNDGGNIQTVSKDGRAVAIHIGDYGVVPNILNTGDILANSTDSTANGVTGFLGTRGGDAYGVLVESQGSLSSFINRGIVSTLVEGPATSAYGVVDRSGTLTTFINSGTISTQIPIGSGGRTIAVDLSANTSGSNFSNTSTGVITGDVLLGAGNTTASVAGTITGAITFQAGATKSGNNTFTANAGTITGPVSLGNGNHTVSLTNGSVLNSGFSQGTGAMSLSVASSQLTIFNTRPLNVTNADFSGTTKLTFDVNGTSAASANGILQSSGQVTFGANTTLTAAFTGIIEGQQTFTVVRANTLTFGAPLSQIAQSPSSFINTATFSLSPTDSNTLLLNVRRKTAAELGLGANQSIVYDTFVTAVNQDIPVVSAISALQTQESFTAGLHQLMPDTSGATLQAALNVQDMAGSSIRRRLVGVAKNGMPDHAAGDVASFWVQAIGDYGDQKARGEQAGFDIWGLGVAVGADMPILDNTTNVGFSITETWHSANLKVSTHSPIEFYNTQLSFYSRYQDDALYVQGIAGGGYNTYSQARTVTIGSLSRLAVGKWKGYQWGGSVEAGYGTTWDRYQFTPYVRAAYVKLHEKSYTEKFGGPGIDLAISPRNSDNGRATVGFTLDRDFPIYYDSYVEAEVRGGYTHEFMNDGTSVLASFVSGGPAFTNVGLDRSPHRMNVGFGVAHKDSYSSVSIDYDAEVSKGYLSHAATITARFRF